MRNVEDVYSLTPVQQGMLFHTLYDPKSGVYVEHLNWTLRGKLDDDAFERAWQKVVDRHPILRSAFFTEGLDEPLQVVRQQMKLPLNRLDWRGLPLAEQQGRLKSFIDADRLRGFELSKAPLMRVTLIQLGDDYHRVVWSHHHMLLDGWSTSLVLREVFDYYNAFHLGEEDEAKQAPAYRDYIAWIQRQDRSKAETFWRQALKEFTATTLLRVSKSSNNSLAGDDGPEARSIRVSPVTTAALQTITQQYRLTLNTIVQGAWALLLSHYSGERDVVFGSIISGRPAELPEVESMVGLFLNALPVRVQLPPDAQLLPWLKNIQAQQVEARQYEYAALADIQSWSDLPRGMGLFDSTVAFENFPVTDILKEQRGGLVIQDYVRYGSRSNYPINVVVEPGPQLALEIGYDRRSSDGGTIARMLEHFKLLVEEIAANPERKLSEFSLLTEAERRLLIVDWNETGAEYHADKCIHHLFEQQAERTPGAIALEFGDKRLTYKELNARANQLAHYLQQLGVGPEQCVGICAERSAEMIVGVLGILKAGSAYLPLDPSYPLQRLAFMLEDARVSVLLTQEKILDNLPSSWMQVICLDSEWGDVAAHSEENPISRVGPGNLAYVIYTSGSTGEPKGVMVEHKGVCNLAEAQIRAFDITQGSRVLQFASFGFDASVSEIFTALLTGATLCLAAKESLLPGQDLITLLRDCRITVATIPPSSLAVLPQAELPDMRTIVVAGETCPASLVGPWGEGRRFLNAYGPTEATVCATIAECVDDDQPLPIGRPIANVQAYLLSDSLIPIPVCAPGELCIGGVSLARGYINRPELTAEKFMPNPFSGIPGARLYRTGDRASYRPDGAIEFLGRIDNQVKVRGYRIELSEIEMALGSFPGVREAVVIAKGDEPLDKIIEAYLVSDREPPVTVNELRAFLQERIPDYMIPSAFALLSAMPLTASGKIDRLALQASGATRLRPEVADAAPRNMMEEVLAGVWAQVLGLDRVGIDDSFFALGGDSIKSVQIISKLHERGWNITLPQIFELQTVRALARELKNEATDELLTQTQPFDLVASEDRLRLPEDVEDAYPLTRLQSGMIFHVESKPDSAIYQVIMSFHLRAPLDLEILQAAAQDLVNNHPSLRTSFNLFSFSEPLQLVHKTVQTPFEIDDIAHLPDDEQERFLAGWVESLKRRHFDMTRPPLLRFHVHRRNEDSFQLTISAYHTIMDGWSDGIFLTELSKRYFHLQNGIEYPLQQPLSITFRDYVALEQKALQSSDCRRYWSDALSGSAMMRLPSWAYSRQPDDAPQFGQVSVEVPEGTTREVIKLAQTSAVLIKHILLAAHFKVMSLLSGQTDLVLGVVTGTRPEVHDSERIIGLFLNTVPLRLEVREGAWIDLAQEIFEAEKQFLPYRFYPLAQIQSDQNGRTLFEVCFNFTHFHNYQSNKIFGEVELLRDTSVTETDFTLMVHFGLAPHTSVLSLSLDYNARDLCELQVKAIADYYLKTLEAIAGGPFENHGSYSLLSPREQQQLLVDWNSTRREYAEGDSIHGLFEARAKRDPDGVALKHKNERITYGELNRRANQIANHLLRVGVEPGQPVGVCMDRSIEMVASLLGILKAGGAYLPLDPAYPQQRLAFVSADAQLRLLLTKQQFIGALAGQVGRVIALDTDWDVISREGEQDLAAVPGADNIAYVIYTSGSTGQPKGVLGTHKGAVNRFNWMWRRYPFEAGEVCCLKTSSSFVDSVWETFGPMLGGIPVVIINDDEVKDVRLLLRTLADNAVTRIVLVPSLLRTICESEGDLRGTLPRLKYWVSSGELLPKDLADCFKEKMPDATLINLYGCSEVSADATCYEVSAGKPGKVIPIGRPIDNMRAYVLDDSLRPVPIGIPGGLYIGGVGLASGYLGRTDLTADRFIPDPFSGEAGARLYRTGDMAQYGPDAELDYLGRLDQQVKIRGFRVEMGEIEAALAEYPAVGEAAVIVRESAGSDKKLIAFIVSKFDPPPTVNDLRAFLKGRLPEYMVPTTYLALDALPVNVHGKLDRQALSAMDLAEMEQEEAYVPPGNQTEEVVAGIWAEVLSLDVVSVESDFFDLGGNSLMVAQILARVRAVFGVEVSVLDLVEKPTVSRLAAIIEATPKSTDEFHAMRIDGD